MRLEQLARLDATEACDQLEAILRGVADAVTAQAPDGRLLFANERRGGDARLRVEPRRSSTPRSTDVVDRFEMLDEDGRALAAGASCRAGAH